MAQSMELDTLLATTAGVEHLWLSIAMFDGTWRSSRSRFEPFSCGESGDPQVR
jgi:hypothetical protein